MGDGLGDRMKRYEASFDPVLPARMPFIIRLDGNAFHTLTKGMKKPFDPVFQDCMIMVSTALLKWIPDACLVYTQSDEISVLVTPYMSFTSETWFGGRINKIISVSASHASSLFSLYMNQVARFDSRVFVLPESDVNNYFIWRQVDWMRNSVQMLARSLYSHKELLNRKRDELYEMCSAKGQDWENLPARCRFGTTVFKGPEVVETPQHVFKDNRYLVNNMVKVLE